MRYAKLVWCTIIRITVAATFGDFNKAKRFQLAQCLRNGMAVNAKSGEVVERDWQAAVLFAAVVTNSICSRSNARWPE